MPMTEEEKAKIKELVILLIEHECAKDFDIIYQRAFELLKRPPVLCSDEVYYATNHKCCALLECDTFEEAMLNIDRARRHYYYAKHFCLVQIDECQIRHSDDYVASAQVELGSLHPDIIV